MGDKFTKPTSKFLFELIDDNNSGLLYKFIQTNKEQIDVNIVYDGITPLYKAAMINHTECVKVLIKAGANVDFRIENRITILMRAVIKGNVKCVNLLIEAGANLDLQTNNGYTALMGIISNHRLPALMETIPNNSLTALMRVMIDKQLECVKALVKAGASLDKKTRIYGDTALILAAYYNHPDLVQLFIDAGADPNIKNNMGRTALYYARENPDNKCRIILEKAIKNTEISSESLDATEISVEQIESVGETQVKQIEIPVKQGELCQEVTNLIINLEKKIDNLLLLSINKDISIKNLEEKIDKQEILINDLKNSMVDLVR